MSVAKQLAVITMASSALLLTLLASARHAVATIITVAPHLWGPTQLSACIVLLLTLSGALGALWHLCSALLALLALPHRLTQPAGPGLRTEKDTLTRLLQRWGAPLVRRAAIGALVAGTVASPALANETAPATDDLGWRTTSAAPATEQPRDVARDSPHALSSPTATTSRQETARAPSQDPAPTTEAASGPTDESTAPDHKAAPALEPAGPGSSTTHVVTAGESLWSITTDLLGPSVSPSQVAETWPELYAANTQSVGSDPSLLIPRTVLTVPTGLSQAGSPTS